MVRRGRKNPVIARPDMKHVDKGGEFNGVPAVVTRSVAWPGRVEKYPFRLRGRKVGEEDRAVEIHLTEEEARKLVVDCMSLLGDDRLA